MPEVQGLPFVVMVLIAPTAKQAMQHKTEAAITAALAFDVQTNGITEGSEPSKK
jgi:hypothetical protein